MALRDFRVPPDEFPLQRVKATRQVVQPASRKEAARIAAAEILPVDASRQHLFSLHSFLDAAPLHSAPSGPAPQMCLQYSRIDRSDENFPIRATFRMDISAQRSGSRKAAETRSWASTYDW